MNKILSSRNQITKNALFLYLRMILVMLISLVSVRILLDSLGVEDYGLYNAIGGVVTSLSFITSTLTNASQRFFSYELGRENCNIKKTFNTVFYIYLGASILFIILLLVGGIWFIENKMIIPIGQIEIAKKILFYTTFSFAITIITNPFTAIIMAYEEMALYAYLSIIDVILKFIATLILLFVNNKVVAYAYLLLIVSILYFGLNFIICQKRYSECKISTMFDYRLFKSISIFSGWTLFGSVAGMGYNQGLNVMLNIFIGPIANAAYAIANQVANAINSLCSGFFSAVRPSFIRSFAIQDKEYSREIFDLSNKIAFVLLSIISIPLLVNTKYILRLWLGEIHELMIPFTRYMIIAILIQNLSMPLTTIAQGANIVKKYHVCVDGFTLIGLIFIYFIFKCYNSVSLALLAYIIIFLIAHVIRLFITKNAIEFSINSYLKNFALPATIIYLTDFGLYLIISNLFTANLIYLVVSIISSSALLLVMSYIGLLTKTEKNNLNHRMHYIIVKLKK